MNPTPQSQYPLALLKRSARHLRQDDVPALVRLEARKWLRSQQASERQMRMRLWRWPRLCIGSFDEQTGEALASLFMRPIAPDWLHQRASWSDLVEAPEPSASCSTLFGISFTSMDKDAADAIFRFFWPQALRSGWREIVLGSPMPALRSYLSCHPHERIEDYARRRINGLPVDPQLRYYHRRGFRQLLAVKPDYFPHPDSMDFGAILLGRVPLSGLQPLWRSLPQPLLASFTNMLASKVLA